MSFKTFSITFIFILLFRFVSFSGEGMWIPMLLEQLNEKEMIEMGMRISAEDIYSINNSSMKDAIVLFGRGCTAEIISNEGLLLTNHHCGFGQIQKHSSVDHDYLTDGFWAMSREQGLGGQLADSTQRAEIVPHVALRGVDDDRADTCHQVSSQKRTERCVVETEMTPRMPWGVNNIDGELRRPCQQGSLPIDQLLIDGNPHRTQMSGTGRMSTDGQVEAPSQLFYSAYMVGVVMSQPDGCEPSAFLFEQSVQRLCQPVDLRREWRPGIDQHRLAETQDEAIGVRGRWQGRCAKRKQQYSGTELDSSMGAQVRLDRLSQPWQPPFRALLAQHLEDMQNGRRRGDFASPPPLECVLRGRPLSIFRFIWGRLGLL